MAEALAAISILTGAVLGTLFYLGSRIDNLGSRIDALGARLDTRIDGQEAEIRDLRGEIRDLRSDLVARLEDHLRRHAG